MGLLSNGCAGKRLLESASVLAGMLLAAPALAQHVAANWISNGEFDAGIASWIVGGPVHWDSVTGSPQPGAMYLHAFLPPPNDTRARKCLPAPLPAAGPYLLSARLRIDSAIPVILVQSFATPDCTGSVGQEVIADVGAGNASVWTLAQTPPIHFAAPPASVQVSMSPSTFGGMWVDNVLFGPLRAPQTVVGGPQDNLHPGMAVPWGEPASRIVVFERRAVTSPLMSDLYASRSDDAGTTWSIPTLAVATNGRDSHPALVQTGEAAWSLFSHNNASTSYRIHRARSGDGSSFAAPTPVELGWSADVEQIGPQVVRTVDGILRMTYWVPGQGSFLARSDNGGASWDQLRAQIGSGHSPRLTFRASDGTWLLVYTDSGLWVKTSKNPDDWSAPARLLAAAPEAAGPFPQLLGDDGFLIAWSAPADGADQLFTAVSADGVTWETPLQHTHSVLARHNRSVQVLAGPQPGTVEMIWAATHATALNFEIVRLPAASVTNLLFVAGFESP